jgi:hypothetical protein
VTDETSQNVAATAVTSAVRVRRRRERVYSVRGFLLELLVVTAGVLIALSLEGLREWNQHRSLVREAHVTIAREIADNDKEVEGLLKSMDDRGKNLEIALTFADELLATKKTSINELGLGFNLAELSSESWESAERTGALSYMDYTEVQGYSRLYSAQDLLASHQRRGFERMAAAISVFGSGDPTLAPAKDLEVFRQHVLGLKADLFIEEQLAKRMRELYSQFLRDESSAGRSPQ